MKRTLESETISRLSADLKEKFTQTGVYNESCPISMDRLRVVSFSYYTFDGSKKDDGEIVVFDVLSPFVENVLSILKKREFPIAQAISLHHYGASDELSMEDNNSSCFNSRMIEGSGSLSLHSYGMAVDINPVQNPFLKIDDSKGLVEVFPHEGTLYLNRHNLKPGMVEGIVDVFAGQGLSIWGGRWTTPVDYHHFQVPRGVAELLNVMDEEDGFEFYSRALECPELISGIKSGSDLLELIEIYSGDRSRFFKEIPDLLKGFVG